MVRNSERPIDLAIMPSFRCNLHCWFCMYDASPDNTERLDYEQTKWFLGTVDWDQVDMVGFYGGEPFIDMALYDKFVALIPEDRPKFVITNGSWSKSGHWREEFLHWCANRFHIIVSGTPEHTRFQDREILEHLARISPQGVELKPPDEIHAQGRAAIWKSVAKDCQFACQRPERNIRLGLKPNGDIVFQNCHGEYLKVQTYYHTFSGILKRTLALRDMCYEAKSGVTRAST